MPEAHPAGRRSQRPAGPPVRLPVGRRSGETYSSVWGGQLWRRGCRWPLSRAARQSPPTAEKKETAIADTLVDAINGVLAPMERKHLHLSVNCPENLTISHDSRWTSEALFNLLDNAVKYTPEGGDIHVTVQDWEMYLEIAVTDTGRGVPESVQATIFKRFYREEAVHDVDGIGIGLYLAREIITMQGGYITVESEVGKGSTFSIFLPQR